MTDRSAITVVDLICEIVRSTPSLPRGLCRSRSPKLFDITDTELAQDAIEICRRCPELGPCGEWGT